MEQLLGDRHEGATITACTHGAVLRSIKQRQQSTAPPQWPVTGSAAAPEAREKWQQLFVYLCEKPSWTFAAPIEPGKGRKKDNVQERNCYLKKYDFIFYKRARAEHVEQRQQLKKKRKIASNLHKSCCADGIKRN